MKQQKGFGVVEIILIIVLLIAIGFVAWFVWQANTQPEPSPLPSVSQGRETPQNTQKTTPEGLQLANNTVSLQPPEKWMTEKTDGCRRNISSSPTLGCLGGATLTPPEKLPTIYGSGTEFFHVYISVYPNDSSLSPKKWFEESYGGGHEDPEYIIQETKTNGYDTYYYEQTFESTNNAYNVINYVFAANKKIVYILARVYEPGQVVTSSGQKTQGGDFRQFIPEIRSMAASINIH